MKFTEIGGDTWMCARYMDAPRIPDYPVNGVVAFSKGEAIVVDLPKSHEETHTLFD